MKADSNGMMGRRTLKGDAEAEAKARIFASLYGVGDLGVEDPKPSA